MSGGERRDSEALQPDLILDPKERAEAEARNGLRQYDAGINAARLALEREGPFRLRPSLILALHREALRDISPYAGLYRPGSVRISQSRHQPPDAYLVPELVEDLCDYVNERWESGSALHLSSYVMWRLNWIHPFADGNGRTSRITSYVVLTVRSGFILPGTPTIPDQITGDCSGYFRALDEADETWRKSEVVDVSAMEDLLSGMLATQLASFHRSTGGKLNIGRSEG